MGAIPPCREIGMGGLISCALPWVKGCQYSCGHFPEFGSVFPMKMIPGFARILCIICVFYLIKKGIRSECRLRGTRDLTP